MCVHMNQVGRELRFLHCRRHHHYRRRRRRHGFVSSGLSSLYPAALCDLAEKPLVGVGCFPWQIVRRDEQLMMEINPLLALSVYTTLRSYTEGGLGRDKF